MREVTTKISEQIDKAFDKVEKEAVKQLKADSKSENYKTLDGLTRSVSKAADVGKGAIEIKKLKDICNKFDRAESVSRADVEKVAKSAMAYLLTLPKEEKAAKPKKEQIPA